MMMLPENYSTTGVQARQSLTALYQETLIYVKAAFFTHFAARIYHHGFTLSEYPSIAP